MQKYELKHKFLIVFGLILCFIVGYCVAENKTNVNIIKENQSCPLPPSIKKCQTQLNKITRELDDCILLLDVCKSDCYGEQP